MAFRNFFKKLNTTKLINDSYNVKKLSLEFPCHIFPSKTYRGLLTNSQQLCSDQHSVLLNSISQKLDRNTRLFSTFRLTKSFMQAVEVIQKSKYKHILRPLSHNNSLPILSLDTINPILNHWRCKSKKSQKRPEYDSESDSEEEDESAPGDKLIKVKMQSLRMDGLLKKTFNVARNKIETAFYEGNIRVNGKKPDKKSFQLRIGDEVDLIRGASPMNPEFLLVSRVEIVSVKNASDEDEDQLVIKVRRAKSMSIENYQSHPWKKGSSVE